MQRLFGRVKTRIAHGLRNELRHQADHSAKPVFVFGMPRSGTTLVEQILCSHPACSTVGETDLASRLLTGFVGQPEPPIARNTGRRYVAAIQRATGSSPLRIVDKMTGNYQWIGLLDAILPNCFFIHCRRHPADVCFSQYKLFFGNQVPYSYDLTDLGKAFRIYSEYMEFWGTVVPRDRILTVNYEDLVASVDSEARRIVDFVRLPWKESCTRFFETDRVVRTASSVQVRNPIHGKSVGRWRRYERWIRPLLDELGEIPRSYESQVEHSHWCGH
jgi:hypothetical protein